MRQRLLLVLMALVGAAALAAADGAGRSSGWDPPQTLARPMDGFNYSFMHLLPFGNGDALAFWWAFPKSLSKAPVPAWEAVYRAEQKSWSPATALPAIAPRDQQDYRRPHLTTDAHGGVVATWAVPARRGLWLYEARRTALQPWTEPRKLFRLIRYPYNLSRSFGPDGSSAILWGAGRNWDEKPTTEGGVVAAVKRAGGRWSRPRRLTDGYSGGGRIAFDSRGTAVALWQDCPFDPRESRCVGRTAVKPRASSRWVTRAVGPLSRSQGPPARLELANDADGSLFAVWLALPKESERAVETAEWNPRTFGWSRPVAIDRVQPWTTMTSLDLSGAPRSSAVAVWSVFGRSQQDTQLRTSTRTGPGTWSLGETLATDVGDVRVATSPGGQVVVAWAGRGSIHALVRRPGLGWGSPFEVVPAVGRAFEPEVLSFDGHALLAWTAWGGDQGPSLQAASFTP